MLVNIIDEGLKSLSPTCKKPSFILGSCTISFIFTAGLKNDCANCKGIINYQLIIKLNYGRRNTWPAMGR